MQPIEFVKKHPVAIGVGVLVLIGAFIVLSRGGDGGTAVMQSGPSDSQVAAAAQLQSLQVQAGMAASQTAAEKEVALAGIAADLTKASYERDVAYNANTVAGNIATQQLENDWKKTELQSSLTQKLAIIDANDRVDARRVELSGLSLQADYAFKTQQSYASMVSANIAAGLESQKIAGANAVALANATKKPQGLFSMLFS